MAPGADDMTPEPNHIYHTDALSLLASLGDNSVDCILTDPPYFRVKGDFDFIWDTREEYMADAREWAAEMARVLRPTGSLVWFTSDTMLAHITVMLEQHFRLLNSCVVKKTNSIQAKLTKAEDARAFLCNNERFVFMEPNGAELCEDNPAVLARNAHKFAEGMLRQRLVSPVRDYLDAERQRAGVSVGDINRALGLKSMAGHWFTRGSQFKLPTRRHYERMRDYLNSSQHYDYLRKEYDYLRKEYDDLRKEYDDLRRPFQLEGRQQDVFSITVNSGEGTRLGHPTVKPLGLIRALVRQITRPEQLVLDPFIGSGTTAVACKLEGRRWIGCEREKKYYDTARRRVEGAERGLGI